MSADRSFPFSYSDAGTPAFYKCGTCGASDCKLWRYAATFQIDLECATCLGKRAGCTFNEKGKTRSDLFKEHVVLTDQAGGCVPAVPAQDGGYWGYTSVPDDACAWWDSLPTYPTNPGLPAK
jgi:hypothetical protein